MTMASSHTEALTQLIREFMAGLREHLADDETHPEAAAEQLLAALGAAVATLALAFPLVRRNGLVGVLLALVGRHWARRTLR